LIACAIPFPPPPSVREITKKNATPEQKAFCVLQFEKHESVVSVQWVFRRQLQSDSPSVSSIWRSNQQFEVKGCLCKSKSAGRSLVSEENAEPVRQSFLCSPKKSVRHASSELEMLTITV
jgi:hypothetical protein